MAMQEDYVLDHISKSHLNKNKKRYDSANSKPTIVVLNLEHSPSLKQTISVQELMGGMINNPNHILARDYTFADLKHKPDEVITHLFKNHVEEIAWADKKSKYIVNKHGMSYPKKGRY